MGIVLCKEAVLSASFKVNNYESLMALPDVFASLNTVQKWQHNSSVAFFATTLVSARLP